MDTSSSKRQDDHMSKSCGTEAALKRRSVRDTLIVVCAMVLVIVAALAWDRADPITFFLYSHEGTSYVRGTVVEVTSEDLSHDELSGQVVGEQMLKVRVDEGKYAGQVEQVNLGVTVSQHVLAHEGLSVMLRVDEAEGSEPLFMVFNYNRVTPSLIVVGVFGLLMVGVGRAKGLRSLVGLAFALALLTTFMLPAMYKGMSPILVGVVSAILITAGSMSLLNGLTRKTLVSIISAAGGVFAAMVFYFLFSWLLHMDGYNTSGADELIMIQGAEGLQVGQVLFVSVLISSLGAVIDMCMSVASPLFEIKRVKPDVTFSELFLSGMDMGRDMIGTMCQTLILAFVGAATGDLILQLSYGTQLAGLISSDYMANEILQSFAGGAGVILCVPLTSIVSAWFLSLRREEPSAL